MIHVVDEGPRDAPVLVMASSLGTGHEMWDPQAAALRDRFRVVRYDARGHGASAVPPGPYDIATLAGDVLLFTARLGIERFHFCGLSIGGQVALWLGIHAPERLERLIVCNSAAKIGTQESWDARLELVSAGGLAAVVDSTLERWFTPGFRAREPEVVARTRGWILATPPEGYLAAAAAVRDCDLRGEVSTIPTPTLVITGAHDPSTPPADGRWLAETIPGAQLVELDAAHLSNLEAEREFTAALLAFL